MRGNTCALFKYRKRDDPLTRLRQLLLYIQHTSPADIAINLNFKYGPIYRYLVFFKPFVKKLY